MQIKKSNTAYLLLLALLFSCCQQIEKPSPENFPAPAANIIPGCNVGQVKSFDLEEIQTYQNRRISFALSTDTHPFQSNDCLCNVDRFIIPVRHVSGGSDPITLDYSGAEELTYEVIYGPRGAYDTIVIFNPHIISSPELQVLITLNGENYDATVQNAGGLCIVDNLSGDDDQDTLTVHTAPLKVYVVDPGLIPDTTTKVYIPESMTMPN